MPDTCASYSPKAAPAFGADCKRCGRAYAEHAPITVTERRTYRVGELLTLRSGAQWRVKDVYPHDDGNSGVGLVNPLNPNHGTAFYADVLDTLVLTEAEMALPAVPRTDAVVYPESGDYPAGNYEVSARVAESQLDAAMLPVVSVSGTGGRQLLQATPAEARALSTALRVAADQADADAGTDATADDTPAWLLELVAEWGYPRRWVVTADTNGEFTIPLAEVVEHRAPVREPSKEEWLRRCREAQERYARRAGLTLKPDSAETAWANRETVGAEESGEERRARRTRKAELHRQAYTPKTVGAETEECGYLEPYQVPEY